MSSPDEVPRLSQTTRRVAIAVLIVLVGLSLVRTWSVGQSTAGIDYYQFWVVGEAVEHDGVTNPYADEERARMGALFLERAIRADDSPRQIAVASNRVVLETYSTPFLYTAIHWLSSGDYETDFARWQAVSLVAFSAGVIGFAYFLGYPWLATLALLCAFLLRFAPFQSETQVLNVNSVQLALLAGVFFFARNRDQAPYQVAAGAVLACAIAFKPNTGLVAVLLLASVLIDQDFRALRQRVVGLAIGTSIALASSAWFFGGIGAWIAWLQAIAFVPPEIITVEMGNYAPWLFIAGTSGSGYSAPLAAFLCLPILRALFSRTPKWEGDAGGGCNQQTSRETAALIGLGCSVYLLSANLVWEHYFILTIPLLLVALLPGVLHRPETPGQWIALRIVPGLALVGLMATPTYALVGLPHEVYFPLVQGGGTLILFVLGVHHIFSSTDETSQ
ncbi:MAG: hypothetical protein ACI8W3_003633 [Myxococcota bacterium]